MEHATRNVRPRALIGVVALALVVAAIWAATALAGSSSSSASSDSGASEDPVAAYIQNEGEGNAQSGGDCPEREDGSAAAADL